VFKSKTLRDIRINGKEIKLITGTRFIVCNVVNLSAKLIKQFHAIEHRV
jgi:hypothetical protein